MDYLYHVEVAPGLGYECIAEEGLALVPGDFVIVQCERYQDYAVVTACHDDGPVPPAKLEQLARETGKGRHVEGHRVPKVIRRATEADAQVAQENDITAQSMAERANERIAAHKLDMKLVHTHYSFDRRLAVFQFAAEGRVDFRELLRDLSHTLRTRVELRQVGVRDEAALQGGIGVCGRPFCCSTFLNRFSSISVKMAKIQGLSLNPANISGACGRLKCCLQYEYGRYREELAEAKKRRAEARRNGEPAQSGDERERPSGRERGRRDDRARGGDARRRRDDSGANARSNGKPTDSPKQATGDGGSNGGEKEPAKDSGAGRSSEGGRQGGRSGSSRRRRGRRRGRRGGSRQSSGGGTQGGGSSSQKSGGSD